MDLALPLARRQLHPRADAGPTPRVHAARRLASRGLAPRVLALAPALAPALAALALAACGGGGGYGSGPTSPRGFSATGTLHAPRQGHTATRLANGKVLVVGGVTAATPPAPAVYLDTAELYDPATGLFTATGPLGWTRAFHTATRLADGKVLIAGGINDVALPPEAELYDPATGTFSDAGPLVQPRFGATASLLPGGTKVLLIGGSSASAAFLASAEIWDETAPGSSATGALFAARTSHAATVLGSGKVLVTGGNTGNALPTITELYDPATGLFTTSGPMSTGRLGHSATLLPGGKVLVAGGDGIGAFQDPYLATAELYDPVAGTFAATGRLIAGRRGHAAASLADGRVLLVGGEGAGGLLGSELYDPAAGTFAAGPAPVTPRTEPTATSLADGRVLVAGGWASGPLSSAELYRP